MARVLVVEDDYDIREVVRIVLTEEGHTVTLAEDGQQAVSLLTGSAEPLIALVDYHLPKLSGCHVWQLVAARHACIIMTGDLRALEHLPEDMTHTGMVSTLSKPFDLENLTSVVGQAAARLAEQGQYTRSMPAADATYSARPRAYAAQPVGARRRRREKDLEHDDDTGADSGLT